MTCALDRHDAVAHVTDDTTGAWLCLRHVKLYELQWRSVGRTVSGFLEMTKR